MVSIKSTFIGCAILMSLGGTWIPQILAQNNEYFTNLSRNTISRLKGNCQGSSQVGYQSQKMISPDALTSVHINMNLVRRGQTSSRNASNYLIGCNPNIADKLSGELVIEQEGILTRKRFDEILALTGNTYNYVVANPISFSDDSRYLVIRLDVFNGTNDSWINHIVLDSLNDYRLVSFSNCDGFKNTAYLGFMTSAKVVFACENPGSPGPIEVFNLQQKSRRKVSSRSARNLYMVRSYGEVSAEFSIVKEQQFPRR